MHRRKAIGTAGVWLTAFCAAFWLAGCAGVEKTGVERVHPGGPGGVYSLAGENAGEIRKFLYRYAPGTEMREAAEFLAAHLPLSDAAGMSADELSEHVDYAFLARQSMPWGKEAPFDVFLRFVLPHRMSQEPAQPFRAAFYKELAPRLRNVKNLRRAVRIVNNWVFEQAAFEPSSAHDQGPLTTIARGKGRCEEMGILLVDALRAAGIPARPCTVPLWRHTEGNHLWVEVYDSGRWHFLGAGEIESDYGLAWFEPALHTTGLLYSTAYGNSTRGLDEEGQVFTRSKTALINRTSAYVPTGGVEFAVTESGEPVRNASVAVHTYNFAAPRAVTLAGGGEGKASEINLGSGVYLATAASDTGRDFAFFEIVPGRMTRVALRLERNRMFEGGAFMPFEKDPDLAKLIQKKYAKARKSAKKKMDEINKRRERRIGAVVAVSRRAVPFGGKKADKALAGARMNAPEVAAALITAPEDMRGELVRMVAHMEAKDLAVCRSRDLIDNLRLAREARENLMKRGILDYGDGIFRRHVLPERVHREPFSHWRGALVERFKSLREAESLEEILAGVRQMAGSLEPVSSDILGAPLTPGQVFGTGKHRRTRLDAGVASAAALRSLGVPARVLHDWPWIEYFSGDRWRPFHAWAEVPPDGIAGHYLENAEIAVLFTLEGRAVDPEKLRYAGEVMICRFDRRLGYVGLDAVRRKKEDGRFVFSLPPGEFWLSSGRRDELGRPYVRVEKFSLEPGERIEVTRELGLPDAPAIPEDAFRP